MVKDISHKIHTLNTMEVCTLFVTPEGLCGNTPPPTPKELM
jgi:hypothetical protein